LLEASGVCLGEHLVAEALNLRVNEVFKLEKE
jgi:hypothetical protein